jgi:hypothetical protein
MFERIDSFAWASIVAHSHALALLDACTFGLVRRLAGNLFMRGSSSKVAAPRRIHQEHHSGGYFPHSSKPAA